VLIRIPDATSKRAATDLARLRKFGAIADIPFRMSLEGEYWRAMTLNGIVYSSFLQYDPTPALRAVELGALGSGLSGTGPAVAAVFDPDMKGAMKTLAEDWSADGSRVLETETN